MPTVPGPLVQYDDVYLKQHIGSTAELEIHFNREVNLYFIHIQVNLHYTQVFVYFVCLLLVKEIINYLLWHEISQDKEINPLTD